jgi:pimeloyl-ACP methyl ester carboxylesterase
MTTSTGPARAADAGPGLLDALALLAEVADELVVRTARDTHLAVADRVHHVVRRTTGGASVLPEVVHRQIASAVYGALGLGLRAASRGLDRVATSGVGPRLEDLDHGRFLTSAVNGLIGDRLVRERPRLAISMGVRVDGREVPLEPEALAQAFPRRTDRVVVFLHGLCENEGHWNRDRDETGTTYGEALAEEGWTPVFLRVNTGLGLRPNGVELAALMQHLVDAWPGGVSRVAMVGHSMGGLVVRAAGAVATPDVERPWTELVTDVVTLGTPHLGAPLARGVGHGSRRMARFPETSAFGRILDQRSVGVLDLVEGLAEDLAPLPRARYHLVAATLTASPRHPVGHVVGDCLVRVSSAYGRDRHGADLFPGADVLHVGSTGHFGLLNHPRVHRALRSWLG